MISNADSLFINMSFPNKECRKSSFLFCFLFKKLVFTNKKWVSVWSRTPSKHGILDKCTAIRENNIYNTLDWKIIPILRHFWTRRITRKMRSENPFPPFHFPSRFSSLHQNSSARKPIIPHTDHGVKILASTPIGRKWSANLRDHCPRCFL